MRNFLFLRTDSNFVDDASIFYLNEKVYASYSEQLGIANERKLRIVEIDAASKLNLKF